MSEYSEAGALYHSRDSSVFFSIYVEAYPDPEHRKLSWRSLANEKYQREELAAKNRGLAVIEHFAADSSLRTITIDYRTPKRSEKSRSGQASYNKGFTFYGAQRTIKFWFSTTDNLANRQAIAVTCASVRINPAYLQPSVKKYPSKEYLD